MKIFAFSVIVVVQIYTLVKVKITLLDFFLNACYNNIT